MLKKIFTVMVMLYTAACFAAVDVNKATAADLDSVKGIGPGTSGKMLEQRKASKFKDWPDLIARVPGIGDKRAAKLSAEGLTVNGAKYLPAATEASAPKAKAPAPTKP